MNCRDFREVADSYLSDELAVETNHEIFQHLENCANCRRELSLRREIREKLRVSLKNSPEFQPNPIFANKLKNNLQEEAFRPRLWFSWKILVPVLTGLLIIVSLTFGTFYWRNQPNYLAQMSHRAVNQHETCGLNHIKELEAKADKIPADRIAFVKSLQNSNTRILDAHKCKFEGKIFTHYILQRSEKVISVLKTASENYLAANTNEEDSIVCEREKGMQVSRFKLNDDLIFVISDMSEAENLSIARQLSDSVKTQNTKTETSTLVTVLKKQWLKK